MLTDQNKALLEALEAKYVAMLGVVSDLARYGMEGAQEQAELEKYISSRQQEIHEAANRLSHSK